MKLANTHIGPDDVVWDIGANCGVFALSCNKAKHVIAVEPDPFLASLINRSEAPNVQTLCAAVSSGSGVSDLCIASRGRASNRLSDVSSGTQTGGIRSSTPVMTLTLDQMLKHFPAPTFIKMDIEGSELLALSGGHRTLSLGPKLYLEIRTESLPEAKALLGGYSLSGEGNYLATPIP